jgi:hypothetical protein
MDGGEFTGPVNDLPMGFRQVARGLDLPSILALLPVDSPRTPSRTIGRPRSPFMRDLCAERAEQRQTARTMP